MPITDLFYFFGTSFALKNAFIRPFTLGRMQKNQEQVLQQEKLPQDGSIDTRSNGDSW
jgi:hypothetical protein